MADGSLPGLVAWNSIIYVSDDRLPDAFADMPRVLAPDGQWPLAFLAGDDPLFLERPNALSVSLAFQRRRSDEITGLLGRRVRTAHSYGARARRRGRGAQS